jgi:hypothetical protein
MGSSQTMTSCVHHNDKRQCLPREKKVADMGRGPKTPPDSITGQHRGTSLPGLEYPYTIVDLTSGGIYFVMRSSSSLVAQQTDSHSESFSSFHQYFTEVRDDPQLIKRGNLLLCYVAL